MNKIEIKKEGLVQSYAITKIEDDLIFSDANNKGLIRYNMILEKMEFIDIFNAIDYRANYWTAFRYKDEIWFIPLRIYERIAIYNLKSSKMEYLVLPNSQKNCEYSPFEKCFLNGSSLYLTPRFYDCILKIDLIERLITRIDIGMSQYAGGSSSTFIGAIIKDDSIFMCPYNHNNLICFDMRTEKTNIIAKDVKESIYTMIFSHNNKLYFPAKNDKEPMLVYDLVTKQMNRIPIQYGVQNKNSVYECGLYDEGEIILFPYRGNEILRINLDTFGIDRYLLFNSDAKQQKDYAYCKTSFYNEGCIICPDNMHTPMLIYENGSIKQLPIKYPGNYFITLLLMERAKKSQDTECSKYVYNIGEKIFKESINTYKK